MDGGGGVVLGSKRLDGGRGVGFGGAVDFQNDEGAGGASGKSGEGFDGGVARVADGSDDGRSYWDRIDRLLKCLGR